VDALRQSTIILQEETRAGLASLPDASAKVTDGVEELRQSAGAVTAALMQLEQGLAKSDGLARASAATPVASLPTAEHGDLSGMIEEAVGRITGRITEQQQSIERIAEAQQKLSVQAARRHALLDRMAAWHDRAARAPLMRILLMPLTRRSSEASGASSGS
jgi:hypothetical protein